MAFCLARCSVATTLIRVLTLEHDRRWYICWGFVVANVIWGLVSVVLLVVHCNGSKLLTVYRIDSCPGQVSSEPKCPLESRQEAYASQFLRWKVIASMDIALEIISFLVLLVLVWEINMSFKMKLQVVLAFIFRLPMVVLSFYHLRSMAHYLGSNQPRLAVTDNVVLLQLMLAWSVISATIPNLRSFLQSFNTRCGMPAAPSNQESRNVYPLVTIGGTSTAAKGQTRKRASRPVRSMSDDFESNDEPTFRPDVACNTTTIVHEDDGSEITAEDQHYIGVNGSQELIIKKEMQWGVQFDSPAQAK